MVYKPFMAQMLAEVANATAPAPPGAWISRILNALPRDNLDAGGGQHICDTARMCAEMQCRLACCRVLLR